MATASTSVGAFSLGASDDAGLLSTIGVGITPTIIAVACTGKLTRTAAPGTVAVDESRQMTLTAINVQVDADPTPTVVTGAAP